MCYLGAFLGLALSSVSWPAAAQDKALELVVAELFCKAAKASDQTSVEYLLTSPLLAAIRDAQAKNDKMQQAAPDEKPPLGDGVPYQSYPDVPDKCQAGTGSATQDSVSIEVKYGFDAAPDAGWTDKLILKWENDLLRIDDIQYAPDYAISLRKALGEMFP